MHIKCREDSVFFKGVDVHFNISDLVVWPLLAAIRLYQLLISPFLGKNCRFYPSCSHYSLACLKKYSLGSALKKIIKRITSCHPWHPGGVDLP